MKKIFRIIVFLFLSALSACGGSQSVGTSGSGGLSSAAQISVTKAGVSLYKNGTCSFGSITTGGSSSVSFVIANNGTADLSVTSDISVTAAPSYFSLGGSYNACTIAPGGSVAFDITFSPLTAGSFT